MKKQRNGTPFMDEDFLLESAPARRLYHEFAEEMPIIDYHCHIPPEQIARDHVFENITQIWLYGDHYKWRAMRACGVEERFCTGDATDWEKFEKWAETLPKALRNPLYHWSHMELKRVFGIHDQRLGPDTAAEIWEHCNETLNAPGFSCRGILKRFGVQLICTTDDPIDSLEHHRAIADDPSCDIQVLPAWRPDNALTVDQPKRFNAYTDALAAVSDTDITTYADFLAALQKRHDYFAQMGCSISDHGLETMYAEPYTDAEIEAHFAAVRAGKELSPQAVLQLRSAMLHDFAVMDHAKGWVQQYHLGAYRDVNTGMVARLGEATGYDSIGDFSMAQALGRFLNRLDATDQLAKTILYNLNPADNAVFATMIGNFQRGPEAGKMQYGSGWWFLDQLDGMRRQIDDLSNLGVLSQFVGMLTDGRSYLSYTRHEYFRRLLCNILGDEMARGLIPMDFGLVGSMVSDICYNNAVRYFGFPLPQLSPGTVAARAN